MPAPALSLRKSVIGGETAPDDYQVMFEGIPIGRILKQPGVPAGRPNWFFSVLFDDRPQLPGYTGLCSDIEECKRRFRACWSGIRATLTQADLERARLNAERERAKPRFPDRT